MNEAVAAIGIVIALAAAARSTWSPCGLSMLSTITPLAERSRGHRYLATASWFVVGGTLGGATLGLVCAALAAGVRAAGAGPSIAAAVAAVLAVVCALSDAAPFGLGLPYHGRQVNEDWLGRYRPWVYASGFGWQIGTGVATYILTAAVYLMIALAALTASPATAVALGVLFGFARGLAVLLSIRITTPERLHAFHRRFDQVGPIVRVVVIGLQFAAGVVAAAVAWGVAAAGAVAVLGVVATAVTATRRPADSLPAEPPLDAGIPRPDALISRATSD